MNDLEDLVVNKRLDVRVVHLVRDARPLVQARSSSDYGTVDGFHKHPTLGYTDEVKWILANLVVNSKAH